MSFALRPSLRPSNLPSLPTPTSPSTYICQSCRHARLLRRPKRPYTFTQLITLSDGSAFAIRTTSPQPVYRSTRDTRNAILWNPSSRELMSVEEDSAGRLAGFRARYGTGFDAGREIDAAERSPHQPVESKDAEKAERQAEKRAQDNFEQEDFSEDDSNLLDLISSFGQENAVPAPSGAKKKGGKK